jgi:hypothetical protein
VRRKAVEAQPHMPIPAQGDAHSFDAETGYRVCRLPRRRREFAEMPYDGRKIARL